MDNELNSAEGEVSFTVAITRANTGETETYQIIGRVVSQPESEIDNGSDTLDGSA